MNFLLWDVPVVAPHPRALELLSFEYKVSQLCLKVAEEDSGRVWSATFQSVQAFKVVTWECGAHLLSSAPDGGFFEIAAPSQWLEELGLGEQNFLKKSRHFVVCTYDDIVHVVAWSCIFVLEETVAVGPT